MEESVRHLLDGVVGLTCVDSSMHPSISAAPLVVSIIAQQCLYVCRAASACHALLNEGGSSFWHIMRCVTAARERYVALHAVSAPKNILPKKSKVNKPSKEPGSFSLIDDDDDDNGNRDNVRQVPVYPPIAPQQQRQFLLSPLDFRVVVAGGGRVGRAIVERLLQARDLIHPSRITIITRQPETVAKLAGLGVQCTGRREGRQALLECHVLVVACQQTQFYDFASEYCPRKTQDTSKLATRAKQGEFTEKMHTEKKKQRNQRKRRTLQDVVNKWRMMEDDDYADTGRGIAMTSFLKPCTFVFSCCAALEKQKIARELGHLEPLVLTTDIDLVAVHSFAQQLNASKESIRSDFIKRVALEGNAFLSTMTMLQKKYMCGRSSPDGPCDSGTDHGVLTRDGGPRRSHQQRQQQLQVEGVGGTTSFLLWVWRALRCFVVVRVVSLKPAEHRYFMYLHRTGPLLGAILVALPASSQEQVVKLLTELLSRNNDDDKGDMNERPLVKLEHRHVPAFDSDDDSGNDEYDGVPRVGEELSRLVKCFPTLFKDEEEALQQLRDEFIAVTVCRGKTLN